MCITPPNKHVEALTLIRLNHIHIYLDRITSLKFTSGSKTRKHILVKKVDVGAWLRQKNKHVNS